MCDHCKYGSIPSGGCHMCIPTGREPVEYLGSIDDRGRILGTMGWQESGSAWVTERQKVAAAAASWKPTGRSRQFQDAALFEVYRVTDSGIVQVNDEETGR